MRVWVVGLTACVVEAPAEPELEPQEELEASDPEESEPAPPVEEPCPFEGEWTVTQALCDGFPLELEGTAQVSGTSEECLVAFDVVLAGCPVVEHVELHHEAFDLWEGYTDGVPGVGAECLSPPPGARHLGVLSVLELEDGSVQLVVPDDHYMQSTGCPLEQVVTLTPGA